MTLYMRYWGKSEHSDTNAPKKWRPYVEHVVMVAKIAGGMVEGSKVLRRNLASSLNIDEDQVHPLVCWAAANHDLGKLCAFFQWKFSEGYTRTYANVPNGMSIEEAQVCGGHKFNPNLEGGFPKGRYWHGTGGVLWAHEHAKPDSLRNDLKTILYAAGAHHGGFPSAADTAYDLTTDVALVLDSPTILQDLSAMREFYAETTRLFTPPKVRRVSHYALSVIAGLISVADWRGSDEIYAPLNLTWNLRSFTEAWHDPIVNHAAKAAYDAKPVSGMPTATIGQIQPPQGAAAWSDLQTMCGALGSSSRLTIIEAPTGDGKTEAAMLVAQNLINAGVVDRMVFALPTKATANAMYRRVKGFAQTLFGRGTVIGLSHGDALKFERQVKRDFEGQTVNQGGGDASNFGDSWFKSGKRGLLRPISVSTIDQVLKTSLSNRHHFVNAFALSTSVVVLDEVHAVDVYMGEVLQEALRTLHSTGAYVILLSATLSPSLRTELLSAWGGATVTKQVAGYPLVTSVDGLGAVQSSPSPSRRADRTIKVEPLWHDWEDPSKPFRTCPTDVHRVVSSLVQTVHGGGCACWIRATVEDAQRAFREATQLGLTPGKDLILLHAGLQGRDRNAIEKDILARFGPQEKNRKPALVIGTSILEQSLDVDFDRMVRDLTTADGLIQALGRAHRHSRPTRPAAHPLPVLEVFAPKSIVDVTGDVYHYLNDHLPLHKTHKFLSSTPSIVEPSGVPAIITQVFDDSPGEDRKAHVRDRRRRAVDQSVALSNLIGASSKYGMTDVGSYAPTRLGEGNQLFLFLIPMGGSRLRVHKAQDDKDTVIDMGWVLQELNSELYECSSRKDAPGATKRRDKGLKALKAALRSQEYFRRWSEILDQVTDWTASRFTFPDTATVKVVDHEKGQPTPAMQALSFCLQATGAGSHNNGIQIVNGSKATVIRTFKGDPKSFRFSVSYDEFEGMVVVRL